MTSTLILLIAVVALGYALHRNHVRNLSPGHTGSTDLPDRDAQRVTLELMATAGRSMRPGTSPASLTGGHRRPVCTA